MRTQVLALVAVVSMFSVAPAASQDAASLRSRIEAHYAAINAGDLATVRNHHRPELTVFFWDGRLLTSASDLDDAELQGVDPGLGEPQVFITDFSAQIQGNVGIATFYLVGSYTVGSQVTNGTWRVTAVWVHENGVWTEAHHHESPLRPGMGR